MIRAVLERKSAGGDSTVVAMHCAQVSEWGVRGGNVEIRPIQDDDRNTRFKFINKVWQHNEFKHRLDHVMSCLVCRGEVLWLVLPDPDNPGMYLIDFYTGGYNNPDPEYRVFYKPGGRAIEKVIIRYSYDADIPGYRDPQKKWVRIWVDSEKIHQSESLQKPELSGDTWASSSAPAVGFETKTYENPFKPYLPLVISRNNSRKLGQQGSGDFHWIQDLIEQHQKLVNKAYRNLRVFANPILVTSRNAEELRAQGNGSFNRNTFAQANRFIGGDQYGNSTSTLDQYNSFSTSRMDTGDESIDMIIGGVTGDERFAFLQVNPVSGDQSQWIMKSRESIHWILGGVDPLGISANATFGEIKTLFGRLENTSGKKAEALYGTTGLCKIFELILWREEDLTKRFLHAIASFAIPGIAEQFPTPNSLPDDAYAQIDEYISQPDIATILTQYGIEKPDVLLLPFGDRQCTWRFTRNVFNNTTREELDMSIAARNEREDGLSQEWVLRKQYPNMTDQEIRNAMSGFSPRVVQAATTGIQGTMQIFQQFMSLPDPADPKQPWGIRLGIPQLLEQAVMTLQKEISYGQPTYEDSEEPSTSIFSLKDLLEKQQINDTNSITPASAAASGVQPAAILPGGLPASSIDIAADRLYRSSYQDPQLRGVDPRYAEQGTGIAFSSQYSGIPGSNSGLTSPSAQPTVAAGSTDPGLIRAYSGDPSAQAIFRALGIIKDEH